MSDKNTQTATPRPVQVTFEVPGRLYQDYSRLAEAGLYMSTDEALRHAVITSWRFDNGLHHSVRVDLTNNEEVKAGDEDPEPAPAAEA